jgi:uncharacterized protein DUF6790
MYALIVLLLMLMLPAGSTFAECLHGAGQLMMLVGKWFVFWSAGVRLVLAGLRQFFQPRFTSEQVFGNKTDEALPVVRELGVANFATGVVGTISLLQPSFVLPVAIAAGIFYGVAGFRHVMEKDRSRNQNLAMISDLFAFLVFAAYIASVL